MTVSLTALTTEVQARCNALTGSSTIDEVIEQAIAAKKVERAGGVISRTVLDTQLQRVINLSGGGSQIEDLISLAASVEISPDLSGGGYTPSFGAIVPFAENGINFTDGNGIEWLKTGYTSTDLGAYPDAVRAPTPNNTYSTRTAGGAIYAGATYSESLGKYYVGSSNKIHTSTDGESWADADSGFSPSELISLPSGKLIALNGSTTYRKSDDGVTWASVAGNPVGLTRGVQTEGDYWYGCNSSQTGWVLGNAGAITSVSVASGSAWVDIAYSPSLRRLVMVGTNLCQSNDAAYAGVWTTRTIPAGAWSSVIWVEDFGLFIAVGNGGVFATSSDGVNWVSRPNLLAVNLNHLTYCPEMKTLYCFGHTGASLYTRDGISWVAQNTAAGSGAINGAAWGGGIVKGLVVAASSSIYKSTPTAVIGVPQKMSAGSGVPFYTRIK